MSRPYLARCGFLIAVVILCMGIMVDCMPRPDATPCFATSARASPRAEKNQACRRISDAESSKQLPVARRLFDDGLERQQQLPAFHTLQEDNQRNSRPTISDDEETMKPTETTAERQFSEDAQEDGLTDNSMRSKHSVTLWSHAAKCSIDTVLGLRACLELRMRSALQSRIGSFLTAVVPNVAVGLMPSKATRRSIQELVYLSASVWADALCRIVKFQLSVVLHALWRQGLVLAHSFSRLSVDSSSMVINTPVLERRRAELRARTAAHDVKNFRARVAHLRSQMLEATARLQEAENDAMEAARKLGVGQQRTGRDGMSRGGMSVTRVSLGASPRRHQLTRSADMPYQEEMGPRVTSMHPGGKEVHLC